MGSRKIYHLHIPRTSGTNILDAVCEAEKNQPPDASRKLSVYPAGNFEVIFEKNKVDEYNFISGHFAVNPMVEIEELFVFSVVREPISQFISCSAFRCASTGRDFTVEELERYASGYYDVLHSFPGFSGFPNSQSNFLCAELAKLEDISPEDKEQSSYFFGSPKSIEDIKPYIAEMTIGTLENRGQLIDRVNAVMQKEFGVVIRNNKIKINSTPEIGFKVPLSIMRLIEERTWLDQEVYAYVKQKEQQWLY